MKTAFSRIFPFAIIISCVVIFFACESDPILAPQINDKEDKGSYANANLFPISPNTARSAPREQSELDEKPIKNQVKALNSERF